MIYSLFFFILLLASIFLVLLDNFLFNNKSINALNNNPEIQSQTPLTKSLNFTSSQASNVIPCVSSTLMQCPLASNSNSLPSLFSSLPILTNNNNLSNPVTSVSNSITNYSNQIANTLNATSCEQSLTVQCPPPPVLDLRFSNTYIAKSGLQALYLKQQNELLSLLQKQQQEQKDFLQKQFQGVFGNVFSQPPMSNITYPNMNNPTNTNTNTISNSSNLLNLMR